MPFLELDECQKFMTENLKISFIQSISAPHNTLILLALKSNGGIRFCVYYSELSTLIKRDQYLLTLAKETLSQILKAKIFCKIDIRQAFHSIRLSDSEDKELTTFRTRCSSYKY